MSNLGLAINLAASYMRSTYDSKYRFCTAQGYDANLYIVRYNKSEFFKYPDTEYRWERYCAAKVRYG